MSDQPTCCCGTDDALARAVPPAVPVPHLDETDLSEMLWAINRAFGSERRDRRDALKAKLRHVAALPAPPDVQALQQLFLTLNDLFTLSGPDVRIRFGNSQIKDDSSRINLALELMSDAVESALAASSGSRQE